MSHQIRAFRLGAFLLLVLLKQIPVRAQYDPGSRDPEAGSKPAYQNRAAAKLKAAIGQKAPDFSFEANDGKTYKVSDFTGRWLLLQFGGSWCPASESTAQYFSAIKQCLDGKPFEFVEIYDDISLDDAILNSLTDFHGIRGFAGVDGAPEFYNVGFIPVWYLIDPKGIIRLDGDYSEPQELQEKISAVLKEDPRFNGISLTPSTQEQRFLDARSLMQARKWKDAAYAWEEILKVDPTNATAIAMHARCLAWTKGYKEATNDLVQSFKALPQGAPDSLKLFQAIYALHTEGKESEGLQALKDLQSAHPDNKRIAAFMLMFNKTPDDLGTQEYQDLGKVVPVVKDLGLPYFYAYALEKNGKIREALAEMLSQKPDKGADSFPVAGVLQRIGQDEAARNIILNNNLASPESIKKASDVWGITVGEVMLGNWTNAAAYAQRFEQLSPKSGSGALYQMLAAMRTGQPERTKEHRVRLENILTSNYKSASMIHGEGPTRDQLFSISDIHARLVTALSAYLFAELDGQKERARKIRNSALNAFLPYSSRYAIIYSITTTPSEGSFKYRTKWIERKK